MIFLVISIIIAMVIAFRMKKRITRAEMLFLVFYAVAFQQSVDLYLDSKYDLYGYFKVGIDWTHIPISYLLFAPLLIVFINYLPEDNTLSSYAGYILQWTLMSIIYEWIALHTTYFYYHGWKLWWSIPAYLVIFSVNIAVFRLFRKLNGEGES